MAPARHFLFSYFAFYEEYNYVVYLRACLTNAWWVFRVAVCMYRRGLWRASALNGLEKYQSGETDCWMIEKPHPGLQFVHRKAISWWNYSDRLECRSKEWVMFIGKWIAIMYLTNKWGADLISFFAFDKLEQKHIQNRRKTRFCVSMFMSQGLWA